MVFGSRDQRKGGGISCLLKAHALHTPTCSCNTNSKRKHRLNCDWYNDFQNFYISEDQQEICREKGVAMDNMCCCRPELTHDEAMKLELIFLNDNEEYGKTVVFPSDVIAAKPEGRINFGDSKFYGNLNYHSIDLIGQNKLIYEIIINLKEKFPVIYLYGPQGSGKTTICKFLMNYMQERGKFKDLQIINKRKIVPMNDNWIFFEDMILRDSKFDKHLYVLEDFDEIIRHRWELFHRKMVNFLDKKNFYFIVTISESSLMSHKMLTNKEVYMSVLDLSRVNAATLLLEQAKDYLARNDQNIYTLASKDIFNRRLMANEVMDIAAMLKSKKSIKEISSIMHEKTTRAMVYSQDDGDFDSETTEDVKIALEYAFNNQDRYLISHMKY